MDEANRRAGDGADSERASSARKKSGTAGKKAAKRKPAKKSASKKATTGKKRGSPKKPSPGKRSPTKKKAPTRGKKATSKKGAKKQSPAAKSSARKKPTSKKAASKKAASKKTAKKAAPKKSAPKKQAEGKASKKRPSPKKSTAKPPKKAAPKKAAPKKAAGPKSEASPTKPRASASRKTSRKTSGKTPEKRPRKDVQDVAVQAKEGSRRSTAKPVLLEEDDLSPVRSSKTSGPLVRVTGSSTRPPADASRVGTPAVLAPGETPLLPGPAHRGLPPEVQPDPSILRLDENRGALSAHGYRLILLHPESLIEIQMALEEKVGLEAGQMIFRGGYVIGLREARRQKDSELSEEEIVKNVAARCAAHGWGIFHIESLDLWRHELIFRVDHSPFAYAYGKSSTGVDHLIRGVFSGVCEVIFDKKVVATESMCRAMGDAYCQFMVG